MHVDPTDNMAGPLHAEPAPAGGAGLADFFTENPEFAERDELEDESHQIGARLAEARESQGIPRDRLANQLGIRESTIAAWEQGSESPGGHLLARVAGLLGVSLSWIIMGRGVEPAERDRELQQLASSLRLARGRLGEVLAELDQIGERLARLGS